MCSWSFLTVALRLEFVSQTRSAVSVSVETEEKHKPGRSSKKNNVRIDTKLPRVNGASRILVPSYVNAQRYLAGEVFPSVDL